MIVFLTSRTEEYRLKTIEFLKKIMLDMIISFLMHHTGSVF